MALAAAVRKFVALPIEQRNAMGQAGLSAFLAQFTRLRLMGHHEAIFHTLISDRGIRK